MSKTHITAEPGIPLITITRDFDAPRDLVTKRSPPEWSTAFATHTSGWPSCSPSCRPDDGPRPPARPPLPSETYIRAHSPVCCHDELRRGSSHCGANRTVGDAHDGRDTVVRGETGWPSRAGIEKRGRPRRS